MAEIHPRRCRSDTSHHVFSPFVTHHENHFCVLFLSKRTWQFFWDRLWKVNLCAGIFQHHFIFSPPPEPRKRKRKMREKLFLVKFFYVQNGGDEEREDRFTDGGSWETMECWRCWVRWLNTNTQKSTFIFQREKLQMLSFYSRRLRKAVFGSRFVFQVKYINRLFFHILNFT